MSHSVKKWLAVAVTAAPFVLFLIETSFFRAASVTDFGAYQTLLGFTALLQVVPYIVWTIHAKEDERLSQGERIIWWLLIWLAGVIGQVAYIGLRIWPDQPFVISLGVSQAPAASAPSQPVAPEQPPAVEETFDDWK